MKMDEKEDIATYFLRVDEVFNAIRVLGEEFKEYLVVQKVLRSLPLRYDAKVSTIEETRNLTKITMDELHGILTAYGMRIDTKNGQPNKEASFKATNKTRNKEHKVEQNIGDESDEEEANFVRNLKRGTGKYKGKLPFKCFNYVRIGHYDKKFPFEEKKNFHKKKSLYSKEDNSSSYESDGEERDVREVLFITQENHNDDHKNFETDEINYGEESNEETEEKNIESFWGGKDFTESEQEVYDNVEKLKHDEKENNKIRNKNRELKKELSSCEEENHELEKTITV
jgi:hypothetical protein